MAGVETAQNAEQLKTMTTEQTKSKAPTSKAELKAGQGKTFTLPGGVKLEMVYIAPGTFIMGSPSSEAGRNDDETQHQVTLTKGFWLGKYEVTQGQWEAIMGNNPSHFSNCGSNCPVEQVSWNDCQEFIRKLNNLSGFSGFRLPTEAEWEYACRAGTTTAFNTGRCLSTSEANYNGNRPLEGCSEGQYREKTLPVGSFAPNAWGLYDMHGNVWEWCWDWHGSYPTGPVSDSTGAVSGSNRVLRGGSWDFYESFCRSAVRGNGAPDNRNYDDGFRLCRAN
jgi:formylglycine-generating enzyme